MTQPTKELLELLGAKPIQITEDTIEFDGQLYVRSTPLREAAPDLYAACKAYLDCFDQPSFIEALLKSNPTIIKLMREAIAKADGRTTEEPK